MARLNQAPIVGASRLKGHLHCNDRKFVAHVLIGDPDFDGALRSLLAMWLGHSALLKS
jgi:hypothetical protein